ncbi:MAG: DegT/DnrJ/EryC1/StrS family aminotransferase [Candidatus Omnitrophica bacterium]|nr:DegT/DnrJ/EryC1/StrS family aminotransferase [Candidatus Omnitrophota bacterium]MDD5591890.1 DegT/DnrJ/EryC1/StrS family aminotransferase [Candidatus Omnitrophota bacterium]
MAKLAINSGRPVRTKPWLGNITTGKEERRAVLKVLKRGQFSLFEGSYKPDPPFSFWGGPWVRRLEKIWAEYYGIKYAISMNSATSGLYAAIGALELGYGDEVIVSPYTMSACAACALIYGAIPIFADVELDTGCLKPESIEEKITPRTKAILVVHQFGIPADMSGILKIAKKHNLKIIEDCAQAHGAKYREQYVGTFGDIGIFSLNVNKTIQTGEGGVCVTNNRELAYRLALIRNHGEAVVDNAGYKNIVNIVGFNFRLTELQAAIGIEQLKKLNNFNKIRLGLVEYLNCNLNKFDCFITPKERKNCYSTYYVYPLRYLSEKYNVKREKIIDLMNAEGVKFSAGYTKPLYLQPLYRQKKAFKNGYPWSALENKNIKTNYFKGTCPNAEKLHFEQMMINEYVRMPHRKSDMRDIAIGIEKIITLLERKYR